MECRFFCSLLLVTTIFISGSHTSKAREVVSNQEIEQQKIKQQGVPYFCDDKHRIDDTTDVNTVHPTVVARSDLGNIPIIIFKTPTPDQKIEPLERCQNFADRLNKSQKINNIGYLAWKPVSPASSERAIYISKYEGDVYRKNKYLDELLILNSDTQPHIIMQALEGITSSIPRTDKPIVQ